MDENWHGYHRRWYDQIGNMTMAVHLSRQLPPEIRVMIARNLNEAIDDYRRIKRKDQGEVSLGAPRVLGLYKAGFRLRWYDPIPELHRAFNLMTTVPERFLSEFAGRVLRVGQYLDQQQAYGNYGDRPLLETDTVEGILDRETIGFAERDQGIRLVAGGLHEASRLSSQGPPVRRRPGFKPHTP